MQSVHIINNVVISNSSNGEVYSIQRYVLKFISDLRQVGGFLWVSSTKKAVRHDIAEIFLKFILIYLFIYLFIFVVQIQKNGTVVIIM